MTEQEVKKLIPEKSFVQFAGSRYKVSGTRELYGVYFIEIYDEPPSKHTDLLKAESVEYLPENDYWYYYPMTGFNIQSDGYFYRSSFPKMRFNVTQEYDELSGKQYTDYNFEQFKRPYFFGLLGKNRWEGTISTNDFWLGFDFTEHLIKK